MKVKNSPSNYWGKKRIFKNYRYITNVKNGIEAMGIILEIV